MSSLDRIEGADSGLTERERQVLEAVVRMYVDTAEPAGSRTISRSFDLGVSAIVVGLIIALLDGLGVGDISERGPHESTDSSEVAP